MWYSSDGIIWKSQITELNTNVGRAVFANGTWVVPNRGNPGIFYSTDGTTWNTVGPGDLSSAFYGNNSWVVTGGPNNFLCYNDSSGWNYISTPGFFSTAAVYGNGQWVVIGQPGVWVSTDNGNSWNNANIFNSNIQEKATSAVYGNGTWVVAGKTTDRRNIWYSKDNFATWNSIIAFNTYNTSISYADHTWVVTGSLDSSDNNIWYSTNDASNWNALQSFRGGGVPGAASYGDGTWVVPGKQDNNTFNGNNIWWSTDNGVTWNPIQSFSTYLNASISSATYANNTWVVSNGSISCSTDNGVTWSQKETASFTNPAINSGTTWGVACQPFASSAGPFVYSLDNGVNWVTKYVYDGANAGTFNFCFA